MHLGHVISGAGHAGLIGWLLLGNVFAAEPLEMEFTEVTVVTGEEWAALVLPDASPDSTSVVQTPDPPPPDTATEPVVPVAEPQPAPTPAPTPEPAPAPVPEPVPDVSATTAPVPEADVTDAPPDAPVEPPVEAVVVVSPIAPESSLRPKPRPAPRVAPTPVAQPEPDADVAPVPQQATAPDPATDTPRDTQDATQQDAATTEIVTEADEVASSSAPQQSLRPVARPQRASAPQPADETPAPTTETPSSNVDSVVADLLKEATGATSTPTPSGPPLSRGESEAFRIAVQECWNVDVGSQASNVVVTVAFSLTREGTVDGAIRLLSAEGAGEAAAQVAFQAARRAILRCQQGGYALPVEKYDQWREIEMTFNPESMRVR